MEDFPLYSFDESQDEFLHSILEVLLEETRVNFEERMEVILDLFQRNFLEYFLKGSLEESRKNHKRVFNEFCEKNRRNVLNILYWYLWRNL